MEDEIPLILERASDEPEGIPAIGVGFGLIPVKDDGASAKAGYPVFKEREFVSLKVPGDKNTHSLRPAKQRDRDRYPKAYAAFKNRNTEAVNGFPIEKWPQLDRGTAMTLKAMGIQTVEALAEVHDGNIVNLGQAGRDLRAKAKAFRDQAQNSAAAQELAAKNEALKTQMADMQRQISELAAAAQKRSPGRPRKEQPEAA